MKTRKDVNGLTDPLSFDIIIAGSGAGASLPVSRALIAHRSTGRRVGAARLGARRHRPIRV